MHITGRLWCVCCGPANPADIETAAVVPSTRSMSDFPLGLWFVSFCLGGLTKYVGFIWLKTAIDNTDIFLWITHPELAFSMSTLGWDEVASEGTFPLCCLRQLAEDIYPVELGEMDLMPNNNSLLLQMLMYGALHICEVHQHLCGCTLQSQSLRSAPISRNELIYAVFRVVAFPVPPGKITVTFPLEDIDHRLVWGRVQERQKSSHFRPSHSGNDNLS